MARPQILARAALVALACLALTGCISTPAPKYNPSVDNSSLVLKHRPTADVGVFTAAPGVENRALSMRGSRLQGGSDGTYSTYLRDALIAELQVAGGPVTGSRTRIEGELTRNSLNVAGIKVGKAEVGARFIVRRDDRIAYERSLTATHEWESSFIGALAIQAGIDNYGTAVQKLIGQLLADPAFIEATRKDP